jgi:RNA polymerase sigma-70 factor (ECF subfamily)
MVMALDAPSFEDVYRTHYGRVRALAARLVADPSVAEEVAHDVFLWFWRNGDRFDPGRGTLSAFLASATRGRAIDRIRADTARRRRELRHGESQATSAPAAESHALRELAAADVHAALDRLPDAEREAIVLAYFGGKTYRQVAEQLGEPEGTIKSRIRSGLRRLRTAPGTAPV